MDTIRVVDMLKVMHDRYANGEPVPFGPITFVTFSQKANTGGEKITLDQAVLVGNGRSKSQKRNPDHYGNYTRNIRAVDGDRIMKIRPLLVTRFNNCKIIL